MMRSFSSSPITMAILLARTSIPAGTSPSITITSATKVSADEAILQYTLATVEYADVFSVPNEADMTLLVTGAGDGEHLNAIIQPGSGESTSQPVVVSVTAIEG